MSVNYAAVGQDLENDVWVPRRRPRRVSRGQSRSSAILYQFVSEAFSNAIQIWLIIPASCLDVGRALGKSMSGCWGGGSFPWQAKFCDSLQIIFTTLQQYRDRISNMYIDLWGQRVRNAEVDVWCWGGGSVEVGGDFRQTFITSSEKLSLKR